MEERLARNPRKKKDILIKENIIIDTIEGHKESKNDVPAEFAEKLEKALFEVEDKEEIQAIKKEDEDVNEEFSQDEQGEKKVTETGKYQTIQWDTDDSLRNVTKLSLKFHQDNFTLDDYIEERKQKEKLKDDDVEEKSQISSSSQGDSMDDEVPIEEMNQEEMKAIYHKAKEEFSSPYLNKPT